MTKDEALTLAQRALSNKNASTESIYRALHAIKEALAPPQEEKLHPVHIDVDVTREGTGVTAFYRKPDAVMEMFYVQFHPMAQPEPAKVEHKHQWFSTGAMEVGQCRCIKCGEWGVEGIKELNK